MIPTDTQIRPLAQPAIKVRPVYNCHRRSLRQMWGIYAGSMLTVITCRYPSKLMRLLVGDPRNSRDPMKYEGRDWKVQS